jgi:hypothetical protein
VLETDGTDEVARGQAAKGSADADRFLVWPFLVVVVSAVSWSLIVAFPSFVLGDFLVLPLLSFVLFGSFVAALFLMVIATRKHHWRRVFSIAVLPVLGFIAVLYPYQAAQALREAGDRFHFYVMRSSYVEKLSVMPKTNRPRLVIWNWGGMIVSSKGVVYDESDEIALPRDQQSVSWKSGPIGELACDGYRFESMGEHFYLAWFPC